MEKMCEHCGQPFVPKRTDAVYCGNSCRQLAFIDRKANQQGEQAQPLEAIPLTDKPEINEQVELTLTDSEISPIDGNQVADTTTEATAKNEAAVQDKKPEVNCWSDFIMKLEFYQEYRNNDLSLAILCLEYPTYSTWVNVRHLSLITNLLNFSEQRRVKLDALKQVCNGFYVLMDSDYYKSMPSKYPYFEENERLYNLLLQFCNEEQAESVSFKISRKTKMELMLTRFELAAVVPNTNPGQLQF